MERNIFKSSVGKGGRVRIEITESGRLETDKLLANMPIELRSRQLHTALRRAGMVVVRKARTLAPAPGYEGDNPSKMSLRESIGVKVKGYNYTVVAFIGPRRPWGNHGHLIEYGFNQHFVKLGASGIKVLRGNKKNATQTKRGKTNSDNPKRIPRQPFMRPAAISTQQQQEQVFVDTLRKGIGQLA